MGGDEDLYSGYDEGQNPLASTVGSGMFAALGSDLGGSMGNASFGAPPSTMGGSLKTQSSLLQPGTAMMRTGTASMGDTGGRPMTSNRGAGFSSAPNKKFDPLNQGKSGMSMGSTMLNKAKDATPEEQAKDMDKKVHELLEESANLCAAGDYQTGLEKAQEAKKRESQLCKFRERNNMSEQINVDLTYALEFNLAHMYHMNKLYQEALNAYTAIVKNKALPQSGRLRVNMGNIYFEQKKYPSAIKMYRMALDQIPATAKEIRFKIMKNIGLSFVRMGQYQDALQSFETVMENVPDHQTGYNLVVCAYALGDKDKMRRSFQRLVEVPPLEVQEDDDDMDEEDDARAMVGDDGLRDEIRKRQNYVHKCIVNAASLIADKIDRNGFVAGFDWASELLRTAEYPKLGHEVELAKASRFLARKEFSEAISVFKDFERKETVVKARAATNLSFLYVLEGEIDESAKFSDLAIKTDAYNARAYVNKGSVLMAKEDYEGAKTCFQQAVNIEPYCVEAIYNLGLAYIKLADLDSALSRFKKLHNMLQDNVEVLYQLGNVYDMKGDYKNAVKSFEYLTSLVPNDPGVLARLGAIHARYDDEPKALHYYQESHRVFPVNMDVISWLGAFHVKNEVYEKAMPYFDLAARIQPQEVKWSLMVASCFRRIGNYPMALARYKEINMQHPDNIECLRYLVHLCTELGRRDDAQEYMSRLRRAERAQVAEVAATQANVAARTEGAPISMGPGNERGDDGISSLNMSINKGGKKIQVKEHKDSDEWGNEELGDDLLPM